MSHLNIANLLTLSRVIAIPVFVIFFYLPVTWNYLVACIIFSAASITDVLDGYFARKLQQTSALGKFMDPVADKLLVVVALVLLIGDRPSIWLVLPAIVIISREIIVSGLREWVAKFGKEIHVSAYGKAKTICQMVAIGCLVYHHPLRGLPIYEIGMALLYIATILTLWSMMLYLRILWRADLDSK